MLSNLTLKKSKQTEKLKVITFFSVAHFGLLLPKTRLILAPIWPFLKNFWFRFRFLKNNSMMMINSTDFASNLQKNRKMWTISYLLRWINNYRVLLLVYLVDTYLLTKLVSKSKNYKSTHSNFLLFLASNQDSSIFTKPTHFVKENYPHSKWHVCKQNMSQWKVILFKMIDVWV